MGERGIAIQSFRSSLAPPRWSGWGALGAAYAVALVAGDLALGHAAILAALLVLAPLACALLGGWADAAAVAVLAFVAAVATTVWDHDFGTVALVGIAVVALGGTLAVLVALLRASSEVNLVRFRLLDAVAGVGTEAADVATTVARLLDIVTPRFADVAAVDTVVDGDQRRLGARAGGDAAAAALLRARAMGPDEPAGTTRAIRTGQSRLIEGLAAEALAQIAADEHDLELLRGLQMRSAMVVPLRARGTIIGALSLAFGASGRCYSDEDLAFAEVLAGRVALALDNAGLTRELSAAERRLDLVLDGLAEAVTVTDRAGRISYANDAAVELLCADSAQQLYDSEPGETMARFAVYDEAGRPVDRQRLPGTRALAGELDPEPLLVRNVVKATGEERWLFNKTTTIFDDEGRPERVVNVIENVTEAKRAELAQRLLARASDALASSLDYEETLQRVAEVAVPVLADWCGVDLPGRGGLVQPVAVAHVEPEKVVLARRLRSQYPVALDEPGGLAEVIRGGDSQITSDIPDQAVAAYARDAEHLEMLRAVGLASIMIVPLRAGGRALGALTLARTDPIRKFNQADLALAEELARRAASAVLNARLYTEHTAIAQTLQRGLRPPELREIPGFRSATLYRPAGELNEVGGDFYDVFPAGDGWMVVVGDVAGQGAAAATLTGLARYTLRSVGQITGDPARAARHLNDTLRDRPEMALCTAICAQIERGADATAAMTIANCGHPRPVLIRNGKATEIGPPGTMAGAFDDVEWSCAAIELRPEDTVVFYTDGVLDTVGEDSRFGDERLLDALRLAPADPRQLVDYVAATLQAFQRGDQRDDTAMVALQFVGAGATAQEHGGVRYGNPGGRTDEIQVIRAIYDAFARRDVEAALRHVAQDAEIIVPGTAAAAGRTGPYRGHDGVRQYFEDAGRVWHELTLRADDIRATGTGVVVFGEVTGRSGGETLRRRVIWTWKLRDGKAVSLRVNDIGEAQPVT
jgi:serine phosphatase RsbU (regulator of sigma subunit)/ketosteroid isomerase-like protein/PAS domain-containing protein